MRISQNTRQLVKNRLGSRLSSDQLISMASILKRKYYIGKAQIGRLLGLPDTILERLFR